MTEQTSFKQEKTKLIKANDNCASTLLALVPELPSPCVSHPADGVTHQAVEALRLEVVLMTDAAPRAAVLDEAARIPPAPAFRPCADVGILDEQPRWVDVVVRKPEPICNDVEVPPDRVA